MKPICLIIIFAVLGCESSKKHQTAKTVVIDNKKDTATKQINQIEDTSDCKPIIIPATTTQKDKYVFQVKNFNATDRSCWESLKSHGMIFCNDKFPCRVIFIENEHLGSDKKDPFYPDWNTLKKYGIGEFTKFKEGFGWQLSGADSNEWGRNQEGFDYFDDQTNF